MNRKTFLTFAAATMLTATSAEAEICGGVNPNPPVWFDCWDCPYQCHGDADCAAEGIMKYRVYTRDLEMWMIYWKSKDRRYNPCLDFDRDLDIDTCDEAILKQWAGKSNVPPDCPGKPLPPLILYPISQALPAGYPYTIHWQDTREGGCDTHRYMLYYSIDAGDSWLAVDANSIDHACSYDWLVPSVTSDRCLIRVDDVYDPNAVTDTLDEYFTICECDMNAPLSLQSPCEGKFLLAGSTCLVSWTDCRDIGECSGDYMLYYSIDNGDNWLLVDTNSVEGCPSYEWHVPPTTSDQCLLRIQDTGNPDVNDVTDGTFCIYECQETVPGDLDADCYVDFHDFTIFTSGWPLQPDFEALAAFAGQWCDCGNPYDPACGY